MKPFSKFFIFFATCFFVVIVALTWQYLKQENPGTLLQQADTNYKKGEEATTIAQRKEAFNKSLATYTQLDEMYHPIYGNGKLYYNIANNYYQLEQYPWAILYYYRAATLMPRNDSVQSNLKMTLSKLSLPAKSPASMWEKIFFFHYLISLPERLQILFGLTVIAIFAVSILVFRQIAFLKTATKIIVLGILVLLVSVGYTRYFEPIEAIIVHSGVLYRDAGEQYAKVSEQPVPSGSKVQVLDVLDNGNWLKIVTQNGEVGYISAANLRVIEGT